MDDVLKCENFQNLVLDDIDLDNTVSQACDIDDLDDKHMSSNTIKGRRGRIRGPRGPQCRGRAWTMSLSTKFADIEHHVLDVEDLVLVQERVRSSIVLDIEDLVFDIDRGSRPVR